MGTPSFGSSSLRGSLPKQTLKQGYECQQLIWEVTPGSTMREQESERGEQSQGSVTVPVMGCPHHGHLGLSSLGPREGTF